MSSSRKHAAGVSAARIALDSCSVRGATTTLIFSKMSCFPAMPPSNETMLAAFGADLCNGFLLSRSAAIHFLQLRLGCRAARAVNFQLVVALKFFDRRPKEPLVLRVRQVSMRPGAVSQIVEPRALAAKSAHGIEVTYGEF